MVDGHGLFELKRELEERYRATGVSEGIPVIWESGVTSLIASAPPSPLPPEMAVIESRLERGQITYRQAYEAAMRFIIENAAATRSAGSRRPTA